MEISRALLEAAVKESLSKRDWEVLISQELGYKSIYDTQVFTGLRKAIVETSAQNVQRLRQSININNTISLESAQNVQVSSKTPPRQIWDYMALRLNRQNLPSFADQAALKKVYLRSRARTTSEFMAIQLVKDCIDTSDLTRASYPAFMLVRVFDRYLSSMPEMPYDLAETVKRRRWHQRWNNTTHKWEDTDVRIPS